MTQKIRQIEVRSALLECKQTFATVFAIISINGQKSERNETFSCFLKHCGFSSFIRITVYC